MPVCAWPSSGRRRRDSASRGWPGGTDGGVTDGGVMSVCPLSVFHVKLPGCLYASIELCSTNANLYGHYLGTHRH